MLEVFDLMQRVAPHFRTALITGEPGTGRKLAARALHNLSPARRQRFAVFKSETATGVQWERQPGWEPLGLSTTAVVNERELFESPFGGTVFVEEVGDLYTATQLRLLRLIDQVWDQEVASPVGPALRVIASTSQDLEAATQSGRFQPGLWDRLRAVQIRLPALRERREDILLLSRHFLTRFSSQYGKLIRRMSRGAEVALAAYSWPRNVAELENVINKACKLAEGNVVDCGDLPAGVVLPGYGDDLLVRHGASLRAAISQKVAAPQTFRERVRDIVDR
jgi:DNA-binding NtrC family response regulator